MSKKITIEVVEDVVVEDEREIRSIEDQYITKYRNNLKLLNIHRSHRSEENKKEYLQQYRNDHKENSQQYRNDNKEKIKENNKKYSVDHREESKEYFKKYYAEHKEEIHEKNKERITCDCGRQVRKNGIPRHKKSQFHKDFIAKHN